MPETFITLPAAARDLCAAALWMLLAAGAWADPSGAASGGAIAGANLTVGCVRHFDPNKDYFPDKIKLEYAKDFSVEYHESYKVVTVHKAYEGGPAVSYVLLQCGAPRPAFSGALASAPLISVPIKTVFMSSTTQIALLAELDRIAALTGVGKAENQTLPAVVAALQRGSTITFAEHGVIDVERTVAKAPSVVMSNSRGRTAYAAIANAGVPVVADAEWLEPNALGRAEWVKFVAVFFNEEQLAQTRFAAIEARYAALEQRVAALVPADERPSVMTGKGARGEFYTAGGCSYVASLISDAGGRYVWADNTDIGTATVDLETELKRAANADFWINGGTWSTLAAMAAEEPRYAQFKAYRRGQVWLYDRNVTPGGANDYWGRGMTRPDLILADLVKIFHPKLLPAHQFQWYRRVPPR